MYVRYNLPSKSKKQCSVKSRQLEKGVNEKK